MSRRTKKHTGTTAPATTGDLLPLDHTMADTSAIVTGALSEQTAETNHATYTKKKTRKTDRRNTALALTGAAALETVPPLTTDTAPELPVPQPPLIEQTEAVKVLQIDEPTADMISPPVNAPDVELPATTTPVTATAAAPESAAINAGHLLKQAREAVGISIDEVSHSLKLAPKQIIALEQQNFEALPARAFVRGFVRNYARLLNIDATPILAALPPETIAPLSPAASSVKTPTRDMPAMPSSQDAPAFQPSTWKWLLIVAVLAIAAAAFFFMPQIESYLGKSASASETSSTASTSESAEVAGKAAASELAPSQTTPLTPPAVTALSDTPTPASTDAASRTKSASGDTASNTATTTSALLELRFNGECWTEVRDSSGKLLYGALAKNGTTQSINGQPPFTLALGNSKAAEVVFRGKPVDLVHNTQGVTRLTLE